MLARTTRPSWSISANDFGHRIHEMLGRAVETALDHPGGDAEPIGIGAEVIYAISLNSKVPHLA